MKTKHWANVSENTFVAGIVILFTIHRVFGRWPFRVCLFPVIAIYWALHAEARRASLDYLSKIHHYHLALAKPLVRLNSFQHFLAFGEALLDKLLAISGRYPLNSVRRVGREMMLEQIKSGRGGVIMTAHIGCLELCRVGAKDNAMKLNILVHTAHAQRFNQLLRRLNPDSEVNLIQVSNIGPDTAILLANKIAQGEFVAIAGDRVPLHGGKTIPVTFLGREAPFPIGPYVLANLLKCSLFMMGCIRDHQGYVVHFEKLSDCVDLPRKTRDEALRLLAQDYVHRLERLLAQSPLSWFNFFSFWQQNNATSP